ncbi:unnamed protein product [Caenorhabditis auriculariae]|uniref:Uncharacterized protein n=1 Tax=Caenorhabditis auriculariae TaxID=2777116 RepID=A0A8S1HWS0_9PELO|nr:unnamed protein product [Caenorhabditis auriculariae]
MSSSGLHPIGSRTKTTSPSCVPTRLLGGFPSLSGSMSGARDSLHLIPPACSRCCALRAVYAELDSRQNALTTLNTALFPFEDKNHPSKAKISAGLTVARGELAMNDANSRQDGVVSASYDEEYDENSSARLFERSRIKALAESETFSPAVLIRV